MLGTSTAEHQVEDPLQAPLTPLLDRREALEQLGVELLVVRTRGASLGLVVGRTRRRSDLPCRGRGTIRRDRPIPFVPSLRWCSSGRGEYDADFPPRPAAPASGWAVPGRGCKVKSRASIRPRVLALELELEWSAGTWLAGGRAARERVARLALASVEDRSARAGGANRAPHGSAPAARVGATRRPGSSSS